MKRRNFNKAVVVGGLSAITPLTFSKQKDDKMNPTFTLRKAADRGVAEHGWLSSRHSFSFANYYDPNLMGFSDLLVINEDRVKAGRGFGKHPHRDMEIFSYVLEGQLEHQDSMGNGSLIKKGDVQIMSAGTGVAHSEYNPSSAEDVHFLQIWVKPSTAGLTPSYQQKFVPAEEKRGKLKLILSPTKAHGSLQINQDAFIYAGLFDGPEKDELLLDSKRKAYVHVARGKMIVSGQALSAGDGLMVADAKTLSFSKGENAEVIVFDLR